MRPSLRHQAVGRATVAGRARLALLVLVILAAAPRAHGQTIGQRGFVEGTGWLFPQDTPIDSTNVIGDLLVRDDAFVKPLDWLQVAGSIDLRANTHDQVESSWRVDFRDRGALRPRVGIRRLGATIARGPLTLDLGKQFIRWGKTDIVTPTDRFAPRDFLNVVDDEFLAVTGIRGVLQHGADAVEAVWVPWLTPSRIPLLDQRWTAVPNRPAVPLVDAGAHIPSGAETGLRWSHTGTGYDFAASFFNGFNHLPNIDALPVLIAPGLPGAIDITKAYPSLRMYGIDAAVPTTWFTIKGEAAYFTTTTPGTDEYVLYVVQLERQTGEWLIIGGYAGQAITEARAETTFAPDRGLARALVARASYTIDPLRDVTIETAIRQNGHGALLKGTYSQARGAHWRATLSASLIRGRADDFLGQYRLNSHATLAVRYSF